MKRNLYHIIILFVIFTVGLKAQPCPQFYDVMGVASSNPYWVSCSGGAFNLNLSSPSAITTYTINC